MSVLASLTGLAHFDPSDNQVLILDGLVANTGLKAECEVWVNGNPFEQDCASQAANLAALRQRGVYLYTSCP